jgi:hypothetical protein
MAKTGGNSSIAFGNAALIAADHHFGWRLAAWFAGDSLGRDYDGSEFSMASRPSP